MLLRLTREHVRPYRWWVLALIVLQVASVAGTLYLPSLNARLVDEGVARADQPTIWRLGGWMLGVSLLQLVVAGLAVYVGSRTATNFGRDLRASVVGRVLRLGTKEVRAFGPASLITRSSNDVQQLQALVLQTFTVLVTAPLTMVGAVIMGLREDTGLSWLMAAAVPILVVIIGAFVWLALPGYRLMQTRIDRVNKVLREQLTGLRVTRVFVREEQEEKRFGRASDELIETSLGVGRLVLSLGPVVTLVLNLSTVAVVWFGSQRIADGEIGIGSLMAFITYLVQILSAVLMTSVIVMQLPRAHVSAARLGEVLDAEPSVKEPAAPSTRVSPGTGVELRGVSLHHDGAPQPLLRDVSFTVRPGETVAVIGPTGSGKTSLLQLMTRLMDATEGQVLLDGTDVRELPISDVRTSFALVPQKAALFSGTVASNLRHGDPQATDEQLWSALETAQARDFVAQMPAGLDSPVAPGGANLSGGQRQRLTIARALVSRRDFYLFDDSLSALDAETDARLRAALAQDTSGAGVVIVAQRLASVRDADRVVVLDEGTVAGTGSHAELLETCRPYAEFVASQTVEAAA